MNGHKVDISNGILLNGLFYGSFNKDVSLIKISFK